MLLPDVMRYNYFAICKFTCFMSFGAQNYVYLREVTTKYCEKNRVFVLFSVFFSWVSI